MPNKEFFSSIINKIIQGNCLEVMKKIPDDSVDVTFADPPFNLKKKYNSYYDKHEVEEYLLWCKKWLYEMVRITKPTGSIFVHNIPKWLIYFGSYLNDVAIFRHWIVWDAMGAPLGKTLLPNHYGILYYVKSDKFKFYDLRMLHRRCRKCHYILQDYGGKKSQMHQFGPLISDVWTDIHRIRHKKRRDEHPCQLPIHLLERLLLMSSDENDIVLDPFIGTGTTAIAAKRLGRRFIGIDIDEKYVAISRSKLEQTGETNIHGCYVSIFLDSVITIRDRDWQKIKDTFIIPHDIMELEKKPIYLCTPGRRTIGKYCSKAYHQQFDLFLVKDQNKK
ncbi:MAG TPA: site-specific DNA-methyltransferase [bacterium]|nr:site-specific DNA-methyltransferase [bacterium]HOL35196.1 site-specific DNA-methyltransferase [bacterium]HPP08593.1 site-specific DNA-methyltransferase [bacterium]